MPRLELPNYKLLSVSKQVREEVLEAGWTGTYKHFVSTHKFYSALDTNTVSPVPEWFG